MGKAVTGMLASVAALALATACAQPATEPGASPSATESASPTADRRAELKAMVDAAALRPADLGVTKPPAEETALRLTMPCNAFLDAGAMAAHSWSYKDAKPAIVSHIAFAYDPERGSVVVDQVRAALTRCQTWTWGGTWDMKVLGEFPVSTPAGVDNVVAYCHHGTLLTGANKGDKVYICDGLASRGNLVTDVGTVKLTQAEARAELTRALPLAAAALIKAVSSP